ncbi:MAG: mechanosensitive ion channel family protein [Balneolales bacterium]
MELELIEEVLPQDYAITLVRVLLLFIIGLPALGLLRGLTRKYVTRQFNEHYGLLSGKVVFYTGVFIIVIMAMHDLGFSLAPLLGAAGVVGVAIGFASQTSVSNIISGLFLIAEQSFVVGDAITVNGNSGVVLSIDTLSVKIRLFNNQFMRIPNETMIKAEVINITRFPIRRVDCRISVAYKEDLSRVKDILFDVADKNPIALQEPGPLMIFDKFGSSSIDILFMAWAVKDDFLTLQNSLNMDIKQRFDDENIEMPFPHVSLYKGPATDAIPIVISEREKRQNTESEETGKQ